MLSRDEAKKLTTRVLAMSKAAGMSVSINGAEYGHLRFARNTPSTSGVNDNLTVTVTSWFGKRSGSASGNALDDDSLAAVVKRSEETARLAPEDPEAMPLLGPQEYVAVADAGAGELGLGELAAGVKVCIERAMAGKAIAAGFADSSASVDCIANSKGLFGYQRRTSASVSQTVRTEDATGSGWASDAAIRVGDVAFDRVSRVATDKALASATPRPLDPGKYVAILEPACVADMVGLMLGSMGARRADEGRSYFSTKGGGNRIGEKLFGPSVSIYSDPAEPSVPGSLWGEDGLPQAKRMWVDRGVLSNLMYDRYWASRQGKEPVPSPSNTIMKGGRGTLDDLIASTKRGVLVTSFWYIRELDPESLLYTGLTRDGVFLIENGKIAHPVNNFRWNESPIAVLKNIEAMSEAQRVPGRGDTEPRTIVPALKIKQFTFSSVSDAV